MNISTKKIVSISEANQNFSKVVRLADKEGEIYIFKNNKPMYRLVSLSASEELQMSDEEKLDFVSGRVLAKYREAFEELAK